MSGSRSIAVARNSEKQALGEGRVRPTCTGPLHASMGR